MKAAKEAAAKVNAMLVASGQLKLSDIEKAKCTKPGNLFVEEVVINESPMSARNFLTMCSTQEEISKMSGASVSTKGRYMSEEELKTNCVDRPLHLQIQGVNEQDVKVAVGRIMHIIMKHSHRKPQQHKYKGNKNFGANAGEKHARTAPTEEQTFPVVQNLIYREKVFMPPTAGLNPIDMRNQLIGENGTNFKYIVDDTGVSVTLRGIGSGCLEAESGLEAPEALHFYLEHSNQDQFNQAKDLVVNLAQTILSEMQERLQALPQPQLNPCQPNIINQAQLTCKPLQANANPLPMATTYETQQLYGSPPQVIVPAVQQHVITSLAPPLTAHTVAPINTFQPQQTSQPYVITSQPMVSNVISHNSEIVVTSNNNIVTPIIPISVQANVQETSQMMPQLVQVSHGSQIIGTPDGPRLITVVCNANGATIVSEPAPVSTIATLQAPIVAQTHPGAHVVQPTCVEVTTTHDHYDNRGEPIHAPLLPHVTLPIVTTTIPTSQLDTLNLAQANVTYHSPLITAPVECQDGLVQGVHGAPPVVNEMNSPFALEASDSQNWNVDPSQINNSAGRQEFENQLLSQPGSLPWSRYPNLPHNSVKPGHELVNTYPPEEGVHMDGGNINRLRDGGVSAIEETSYRPYSLEASFAPNFYQHTGIRPYASDLESNLRRTNYSVARGMLNDTDETCGEHITSSNYLQSGYPSQIENVHPIDPMMSRMGLQQNGPMLYSRRHETVDVKPSTYNGPIEYNHSMRPKHVPPQLGRESNVPSSFPYSSRRPFSHQRNY